MGIYLNPGNDGFTEAIRSEIYVDKTGLITYTNKCLSTEQKFICVSRPRRFGKSMALKMLAAYYSCGCDSRQLFAGLKIEKDSAFEEHLNQYDVIFLNMQQFLIGAKNKGVTDYLEQEVLEELLEEYGTYIKRPNIGLEEYTGFTEREVKELCRRYAMDFDEISSWYDGYRFRKFKHVYNPRSVVAAVKCGYFSNYWTATETYEALKIYMDMDFDGLRSDIVRMLGGEYVRVNTLSFQNDMHTFKTKDDVLTLLIHLGYLGFDAGEKTAFIPNKEIIGEFENAMSVGGWSEVMSVLRVSTVQ